MDDFYVNKVEINGNEYVEINNDIQLKNIIDNIRDEQVNEIAFYRKDKNVILNVFADVSKFHISIIDEDKGMNYYFNSQSNNKELVELGGNFFDANNICYDQNVLERIVNKFVLYGEKYEKVKWLEEEE
ncbi:hypothetical protein [Clostridium aciditolerans]|uniref:Uncharacterized protein n=1 Tax=Clostridium aciditolerans TaxID=339861 RepID=A0A934I112_9CLOT|nr:hypothetical protein [Clostridium aciditolerans]MBI6874807.1 hypothetical protein [Clostridium aciditolerans]